VFSCSRHVVDLFDSAGPWSRRRPSGRRSTRLAVSKSAGLTTRTFFIGNFFCYLVNCAEGLPRLRRCCLRRAEGLPSPQGRGTVSVRGTPVPSSSPGRGFVSLVRGIRRHRDRDRADRLRCMTGLFQFNCHREAEDPSPSWYQGWGRRLPFQLVRIITCVHYL
jgi:hypothetical protein